MKKIFILASLLFLYRGAKAQCYVYKLADLSVISVKLDTVGTDRIIVDAHITSKVDSLSGKYPGKFQQVDYNVLLNFSPNLSAAVINDSIPIRAQMWINETYNDKK